MILLIGLVLGLFVHQLQADDIPWGYEKIAAEYGLPSSILYSVALQESESPDFGKPWPWTANFKGDGYYFESREELYRFAQSIIKRGYKSIDIGPGQVNWRWNGERFSSLWDATDPYTNLRVAAAILIEHFAYTGSWPEAVGRYHSPSNPHRALRYAKGVGRKLANVMED
ncbi:MAG: lytic transglycosylase domain-containing protein [Candidatus Thiodiazotropha sp.]